MQMVMTSDGNQIQTFADWQMSHAKRVAKVNRKTPEYHVVATRRRLRTQQCRNGQEQRQINTVKTQQGFTVINLPLAW